jgi:hypothetical protein
MSQLDFRQTLSCPFSYCEWGRSEVGKILCLCRTRAWREIVVDGRWFRIKVRSYSTFVQWLTCIDIGTESAGQALRPAPGSWSSKGDGRCNALVRNAPAFQYRQQFRGNPGQVLGNGCSVVQIVLSRFVASQGMQDSP